MKSKYKQGLPVMMMSGQQLKSGRDIRREEAAEMKRIMDEVAKAPPYRMSEVDKRHNQLKAEAARRIARNGLTMADLKQSYKDGWDAGFKEACEPIVKSIYAGICVALNEKHGFGGKRCMDVLNALDSVLLERLTSQELVDEVYEKLGLTLNFSEPFDRVDYDGKTVVRNGILPKEEKPA